MNIPKINDSYHYLLSFMEMEPYTNEIIYSLKNTITLEMLSLTSTEIVMNKDIVKNLKPEDALAIGYTAGMVKEAQNKFILSHH